MNIQPKKFYDPAIAEPAAAVIEPAQSIAALMASHGVTNNTNEMVATPVVINSGQPTPAPEASPAATAPEPSTADPANPEPLTPVVEPPPTPTPAIPEEPASVPTWQEVLRQQQPGTILKELGLDEKVVNELKELDPKMIAFLTHWKNNGDVTGYLRELSTDYSKMSAEDVMRHQLRQEYPKATQQQLEALYKREVVKAYSLDSEDEAEREEGIVLLGAKADKHRDVLIQNQQGYLLPKSPEPRVPEPDTRAQEQAQRIEAYQTSIKENAYTKSILASNQISIGEGEDRFNFPVKSSELVELLFDDKKWGECLFEIKSNPDGTKTYVPDVEKQFIVSSVMKYGKSFLNAYADHYKTLGSKSSIARIENATPPSNNTPAAAPTEPKTVAEAMARGGRLS